MNPSVKIKVFFRSIELRCYEQTLSKWNNRIRFSNDYFFRIRILCNPWYLTRGCHPSMFLIGLTLRLCCIFFVNYGSLSECVEQTPYGI